MEATSLNNSINAINDVRTLLNELRSNLSHEQTMRIRKKLRRTDAVYNILKEKEQKSSLTSRQTNMLRNDERYLKNISMHLKNLKQYFKKLQKYQYGIDYLFNGHNEEDYTSNNDINAFQEARKLLHERRSNLLLKETNKIRKKFHKKEAVYNFLKDKGQKDSLTNEEKKVLKKTDRYLKNFKKDLDKLQKYQYNTAHGLDYLFNEEEEDYYKPTEVKSAFDGSYMSYESKGDKDARLSIDEYFDIIRPYLKDMIDSHKARNEWKIQLSMRIIFVSLQMQIKLVKCIQKVII